MYRICMYIHIHIYMYMYRCISVRVPLECMHECVHIQIRMYAHVHVYMNLCRCVCMYELRHMYACMHICQTMHTHTCVCVSSYVVCSSLHWSGVVRMNSAWTPWHEAHASCGRRCGRLHDVGSSRLRVTQSHFPNRCREALCTASQGVLVPRIPRLTWKGHLHMQ